MSTSMSMFLPEARSRFTNTTRDRYRHMEEKVHRIYKCPLPFTLAQLRSWVLDRLENRYDGVVQCRYCRRMFTLAEVVLDHMLPLERGGWIGLENLDLPCAECNAQKGSDFTPEQFHEFLFMMETKFPMCRPGVLLRLQEHPKLLAQLRKAEMLARGGMAKKNRSKPPLIEAIDENF